VAVEDGTFFRVIKLDYFSGLKMGERNYRVMRKKQFKCERKKLFDAKQRKNNFISLAL
jgi:hypothetical protein